MAMALFGAIVFTGCSVDDSENSASVNGPNSSKGEWSEDTSDDSEDIPSASTDGEVEEIPDSAEGLKPFVSLNVNDMAKETLSAEKITNNIIVIPGPAGEDGKQPEIVIESKGATVGQTKYTNRLKLGGFGSVKSRAVRIYVGANQKGRLSVDCASSSSKDSTRKLMANSTEIGNAPTSAGSISASVTADENGYISLFSANGGGINIYGIYWSQGNAAAGGVDKIVDSKPQMPVLDNSAVAPAFKYGRKVGTRTNISEIDTDSITNVIFVAPNGKPEGNGTKPSPLDLQTAITKVVAGGAIVLKGGVYKFSDTVKIDYTNCGSEGAMKYILPESGKAALFDFSAQPVADSARGFQLDGSFWHIYGITCYNAGDNGMYVTGKNNIVERCIFQANQDTGLQIARRASTLSDKKDWPENNLILNCTAFDNKDDKTGENADGFASKLTCGEGNVFDGCISYANCDDGWDLYAKPATGPIGIVTIRNCVAYQNGKTTSGQNYANGDMNGFKLGGSNNACPTPHVVYNCAAFLNGKDGFTDNGNGGALDVSDCTSYGNVNSNFNFYRTLAGGVFKKLISMNGSVSPAQVDKFGDKSKAATISKSIYYGDKKAEGFMFVDGESAIHNGDKIGTRGADPFKSEVKGTTAPEVSLDVDSKCRNKDGTINLNGFLETKDSSNYASMGAHFGDEAETIISINLK